MREKVLTVEYIQSVGKLCQQYGLKLHMDASRLMNAAVKLDVSPAELVEPCDPVLFCLSKDHQNAKLLTEGLSKINGCEIDCEKDV
ncbi:unnamed protein product [Rotaria socialis]|uniref:Aromatic amino acid beta-eliminating lyase/threonine aldolase domain-containing protein n=1 Tax=Rotaria socialis TaxID=392032 RepID=A0A818EWX7_9BILA|nr:unnamed protein product [Rotaria socialis]